MNGTDPNPVKSKTKCMLLSATRKSDQVRNVELNGDLLSWVETAKHLGNHLSSKINSACRSPDTRTDLFCKEAIFFDSVHQVQQQFGYHDPQLVIRLLSIYSTAMYGSPLWQLNSEEHQKLNRSWNTAVKMIFDLPNVTHTCFIEPLSPVPHFEAVLIGRYIGFLQSLLNSSKPFMGLLFTTCSSDLNSVTGNNIGYLLGKFSKSSLKSLVNCRNEIKNKAVYHLPENEKWKVKLISEISLVKEEHLDLSFNEEDLEEILEYTLYSWGGGIYLFIYFISRLHHRQQEYCNYPD